MKKAKKIQPIWPVAHPTSQFKEDVKEIARQKGWKIIDARYCKNVKPELLAKDTPKLTPIDKKKQAAAHQEAAASQASLGAPSAEAESE